MAGNDSFTKVLLHMEGAQGGTSFVDGNLGGSAHTWTGHGTAVTINSQIKFGLTSLGMDGSGTARIDTPDSADFTLGTSDWTIDLWFYALSSAAGTRRFLFGQSDNSGVAPCTVEVDASDHLSMNVHDGTTNTNWVGATTITTNTWHHFAIVRSGSSIQAYLDGTAEGSAQSYSTAIFDSAQILAIGALGQIGALTWSGYIDEFRYSVGTARWTSNFTPPTIAYGPSDLTASAGSLALSGIASNFKLTGVHAAGAYVLTGVAATFPMTRKVAAAVGTYVLSGVTSTVLRFGRHMVPSAGSYVLTGGDGILTQGRGLDANPGVFVLTGTSVYLVRQIAGAAKTKLRRAAAVLRRTRRTDPTLGD